jgi:uncharacterized protein
MNARLAIKASAISAFLILWACLEGGVARAGTVDLPYQISGSYSVPVNSLREVKFAATVRQQYDFSCGSAALSTLLTHHYKFPVTEEKIFEQMFLNGDQAKIRVEGFSLLDMKRYLEAQGFQADGFEEPLDKLVTAKIPAVVLINNAGYNHFVVVKGIQEGRVLIGDPAGGARAMTQAAFESIWVNGVLFVITEQPKNRTTAVAFNSVTDWNASPSAPLRRLIGGDSLSGVVTPRLGPSDF